MVKQEVLAALDAVRGRYISGQELAVQLGVSRTAVWKAVAALRRDGIPIKAVTNRGYTLAQSVDVLNAAAVVAQLDEATVKALQIEVVDRLPGTNAALRSRADAGAREGLVLIAQAQSAGRGRGGHSFYSPPGGLYMSILLRPEIGARQAVGLTAMAAVAAARAAQRLCGVPITIKWVNDLWKNGKKVCGILTEAALDLESGMLDYAVLGLGFNVAAPADGWPEDLRDVADVDGIIVPGGFGDRGIEGMIQAAQYARENHVPYFGICLGMQIMVMEFARNVLGYADANSSEFTPDGQHNVIALMADQQGNIPKGGTMRLGKYPCTVKPGTKMAECYGEPEIWERHRHRYEFNNDFRSEMEEKGLVISGTSPDGRLVETVELPGRAFHLGAQFHPEFKSRPNRAHPLFKGFIAAALQFRAAAQRSMLNV